MLPAALIRAICRSAKTKAVALTQVEDQIQNASGAFQSWAAYQAIAADASTAILSSLNCSLWLNALCSARLNRALGRLKEAA
jgi:hypothetical protein